MVWGTKTTMISLRPVVKSENPTPNSRNSFLSYENLPLCRAVFPLPKTLLLPRLFSPPSSVTSFSRSRTCTQHCRVLRAPTAARSNSRHPTVCARVPSQLGPAREGLTQVSSSSVHPSCWTEFPLTLPARYCKSEKTSTQGLGHKVKWGKREQFEQLLSDSDSDNSIE